LPKKKAPAVRNADDSATRNGDVQRRLRALHHRDAPSARGWPSFRTSVSILTFSMTAGLPEAMALISA
jgi:hypothetical protein